MWRVVHADHTCKNFNMLPARKQKIDKYACDDTARLIPLTQGQIAVVDRADYPALSRYKWFAHKEGRTFYAVGNGQKRKHIIMHRMIMNAPKNMQVDHIDHDGLNNTRKNLRLCTPAQNRYNMRPQKNKKNRSKLKGVFYVKSKKKYKAQIGFKGKTKHIGYYKTQKHAGKAYDKMAKKLFGEFAYLNFPEDTNK